MAVRTIKTSWWIDFRFNYKRYRKRSPENSRAGARAYEVTLRQKLARGEEIELKPKTVPEEHLFETFSRKWFDEYVIPNNKPSEQRAKMYILSSSLIPFFGKLLVERITTRNFEQYKATQTTKGLGRKTINNHLTVLNTCLSAAYDWLELKTPRPKVKWLKCPPPRIDYLSPDECELLLSHATGTAYELILTALRTGMRQGELKGLQWESIDWQNRSLVVRHSRSDYTKALGSPKSNRERHIPLDIDIHGMLLGRKQVAGYVFMDAANEPFDHYRLSEELEAVCKKAGLRKITWHTLRHSFASQLAAKGIPLNIVQTLLGHASITTTMKYAHVAPSTLRTAIDLMNPKAAASLSLGQPVGNQWLALHQQNAA